MARRPVRSALPPVVVLALPPVVAALLAAVGLSAAGAGPVATVCAAGLSALVVGLQVASVVLGRRSERGVERRLAAGAVAHRAATLTAIHDQVDRGSRYTVEELRRSAQDDVAQLEALGQLVRLLEPTAMLPRTRGWAASPDVLGVLVQQMREIRPATVVDLGSGVSSLVLALTARRYGIDARIVSIDHDADYAAQTRAALVEHGVDGLVEVRVAPLRPTVIDGVELPWYDASAVEDLTDVGLVFVDGPPGTTGPQARYPALPLLRGRLAAHAVFVVDDAARPDERAMLDRWTAGEGVTQRTLRLEKGAAVVNVTAPTS